MKVLIVDDTQAIVEVISMGLAIRWPEAEVFSTGLGRMAAELVKKEAPDIVVLDLGLPDISGYEVLEQVREFSKVPIMILSVRAGEDDILRSLRLGADGYMTKPFRLSELISRMRALIGGDLPSERSS